LSSALADSPPVLVESALLKEVHLHVWEGEPKSRSVNEVEDRREGRERERCSG
jgi:hypothetical protein